MKEILNKKDKQKILYIWMLNQDYRDKEKSEWGFPTPIGGMNLGQKGN